MKIIIDNENDGTRLDKFLSEQGFSRSKIQSWIKDEKVFVNYLEKMIVANEVCWVICYLHQI